MMSLVGNWCREQVEAAWQAWNTFWFSPSAPHKLACIRIAAGAMLFYTHLVWGFELEAFAGADGFLPLDVVNELQADAYVWSYLNWIESPTLLWSVHLLGLIVFGLLTVGLWTRFMSILAWIITISYCHRLNGAFFGLDQVNAMLAMYLMVGDSGAVFSVDHWRKSRAGGPAAEPSISNNLAIRLIQTHLCVIYLFGGISKMRGQMWWDGTAVWYALANLEYQSWDMTWLVHYPNVASLLTHVTIFWETFYCVLVWPRQTRPYVLAVAVGVHAGIALFLGMITFGVAMLIANLAFVPTAIFKTSQR